MIAPRGGFSHDTRRSRPRRSPGDDACPEPNGQPDHPVATAGTPCRRRWTGRAWRSS